MIVFDTRVISELMRPAPSPEVTVWFDSQPTDDIWTTAVTMAELLLGVERMPQGQRKAVKRSILEHVLSTGFGGYVLPFDEMAATHFAPVMATRIAIGRPISVQDGQIAAICRDHNATLATRNVKDFEHTGVELINPWDI